MTTQAYQVPFQYEPPLLRARVSGRDTSPQVTLAYWREIAQEARRRGAELLLFQDDIEGPVMSDPQLAGFFDAIEGEGLDCMRIAYVEHSLTQMARIEAAQMMGRERGYTIQVFAHELQALDWLRYGE